MASGLSPVCRNRTPILTIISIKSYENSQLVNPLKGGPKYWSTQRSSRRRLLGLHLRTPRLSSDTGALAYPIPDPNFLGKRASAHCTLDKQQSYPSIPMAHARPPRSERSWAVREILGRLSPKPSVKSAEYSLMAENLLRPFAALDES